MSSHEQPQAENESVSGETFFQNMERHLREHRAKQFPLVSLGIHYETLDEYEESERQYREAISHVVKNGPQLYGRLGSKALSRNDLEGDYNE